MRQERGFVRAKQQQYIEFILFPQDQQMVTDFSDLSPGELLVVRLPPFYLTLNLKRGVALATCHSERTGILGHGEHDQSGKQRQTVDCGRISIEHFHT
jgi:hypothetical protein